MFNIATKQKLVKLKIRQIHQPPGSMTTSVWLVILLAVGRWDNCGWRVIYLRRQMCYLLMVGVYMSSNLTRSNM